MMLKYADFMMIEENAVEYGGKKMEVMKVRGKLFCLQNEKIKGMSCWEILFANL